MGLEDLIVWVSKYQYSASFHPIKGPRTRVQDPQQTLGSSTLRALTQTVSRGLPLFVTPESQDPLSRGLKLLPTHPTSLTHTPPPGTDTLVLGTDSGTERPSWVTNRTSSVSPLRLTCLIESEPPVPLTWTELVSHRRGKKKYREKQFSIDT